ncbi:relaxase/mobilization nuclease domain-containing protein [Mangrovactinospora gilvigrisea]|uniref:relaxase/mobilization nuclease domain-containing protein n=1 Tax=Mangrovactinospora gilvigrisea TaxID=1428644 RepID=UPI001587C47C|nr:relaxase/mobilization nuclease domain-containing protein [Mangrovactinospora gilvigrisea]
MPDISTGSHTPGLLRYLYGPGRRDEHTDPHLVAAWDLGAAPDPGRDADATPLTLAIALDLHVDLVAAERGKLPPKHVWHCPVRTAPGDRMLTDAEWAQVARRIVAAAGIAREDDPNGCRWIAVRHAEDHIHIVATTVQLNGHRPPRYGEARRVQAECRSIEAEFGLRRLKRGDGTAAKRPTSAEQAAAQRTGAERTDREELRSRVRTAVAAAGSVAEFFDLLEEQGVVVKKRVAPSGDVIGYSVALPGQKVAFGGGKLAPDLSLPRIRERLDATTPEPADAWPPMHPRHRLADQLLTVHRAVDGDSDPEAQGHIAALGEALDALPAAYPRSPARGELKAAAVAFERASRSRVRAEHAAAGDLRWAVRSLLHPSAAGGDGEMAGALIAAVILAVEAAVRWHQAHGHAQQQAAARAALDHLRTAYRQAARPQLAALATRAPAPTERDRLTALMQQVLPEQAARILADPAWPALAAVLAQAAADGHNAERLLWQAAAQRELDTASRPAEVLVWRLDRLAANPTAHEQRAHAARTHTAPHQPSTTPDRTHTDTTTPKRHRPHR